jgi:Fic family protein
LAEFLDAVWRPSGNEYGPRRERRPCAYRAYLPDRLSELPLDLPAPVIADVSDAERAVGAIAVTAQTLHLQALARFLLRAEAVASSRIEGLVVSSRRLARHEAKLQAGIPDQDRVADQVLGNIQALKLAVHDLTDAPAITVNHLFELHAALQPDSPADTPPGTPRNTQNWIGGNAFNPCAADFVPPPPEHVRSLLADLCEFVNDDQTSPLVQAAIAHAAFETIHPFPDGNGRVGRALIHIVLIRRGLCQTYVPPISLALAATPARYVAGLTAYRYTGLPDSPDAREGVTRWIETFATAARRAADDGTRLANQLADLEKTWRETVRPRRNSAADRLLPLLPAQPVVSAKDITRLTGASAAAAHTAIQQLSAAGVLAQVAGNARNRLWEARAVLDVLNDTERAAVTPGGDTRLARPAGPVPDRTVRR